MKKKKKTILHKLCDSPINYYSDLFMVVMVLGWALSIPITCTFSIYSTLTMSDNSLWAYFVELVTVPLTAGGAIWMVKNAVQHAIINKLGKKCTPDFPKVNADGEDDCAEKLFNQDNCKESEDIEG